LGREERDQGARSREREYLPIVASTIVCVIIICHNTASFHIIIARGKK